MTTNDTDHPLPPDSPPDVAADEADVPAEEGEPSPNIIAGTIPRFLASLIDTFLLAIPLIILGFVLRDVAYTLGPWGRLLGYTLITLYWGYYNSHRRHGQSIGKRVLNIAVVAGDRSHLSLRRSLARASILSAIFLLSGWALPALQTPFLSLVQTVVALGGGLALFYGLVFNRRTKQGIHDLLLDTYVIKAGAGDEADLPAVPMWHRRITVGLVGLGLLVGLAGFFLPATATTPETDEWREIEQLYATLAEDDEFFTVAVNRVNRRSNQGGGVLKDLQIEVWAKTSCERNPDYCEAVMYRIARTVFAQYDALDDLTGMRITVANRFDFGLARGNNGQGAAWRIEDWRERLE